MGQHGDSSSPPSPTPEGRKRGASVSNGGDRRQNAANATSPQTAFESHEHDEMFPAWEREQMEDLLNDIRGTLGAFPFNARGRCWVGADGAPR
jgi:hypothetical protein